MSLRSTRVSAFFALSILALACGGTTFESQSDGGGGTDAGGGADAGGADTGGGIPADGGGREAGPTGCPASPPAVGAACSQAGLMCEWGSSPVPDCDREATCTGGVWAFVAPSPGGFDCGGAPPISCPASFDQVPVQHACSSTGYCDYPQGRCACSSPSGPVEIIDGAVATFWYCQEPPAGCPRPRARLGTSCTQEGLSCDYGTCGTVPGGNAQRCAGGVWVTEPVGCAL